MECVSLVQLIFLRFFSSNRSGGLSYEDRNLRLGLHNWFALLGLHIWSALIDGQFIEVNSGSSNLVLRLHQIDMDLLTFDSMSDVMAETTEVLE